MSEQLVKSEHLETPRLVVVSNEAREKTKEFLRLCQAILVDPNAFTFVRGRNSVEKRISHRVESGTTLKAARASTIDMPLTGEFVDDIPRTDEFRVYSQLGVINTGGDEMRVSIDHRKLQHIDFTKDPFVELIMSYFRTHLDIAS